MDRHPQIPPHDLDAEQTVLGVLIAGFAPGEALDALHGGLCEADFFRPAHAALFDLIQAMIREGEPVELASVVANAKAADLAPRLGGLDWIIEAAEAARGTFAGNLPYYCARLRACRQLRTLIVLGAALREQAFAPLADPAELVRDTERQLYELVQEGEVRPVVRASQAVERAIQEADTRHAKGLTPGIATGIDALDRVLGGLCPGQLVIVGGATSVGKSAIALTIAGQVAAAGGAVLHFSAEMSAGEIAYRLLAARSGVDMARLRLGNLDQREHGARGEAQRVIDPWPLWVYDRPCTVQEIASRARQVGIREAVHWSLIVVDYLQILRPGKAQTRAQAVSDMAWALKVLAQELECPVMAASQMNRQSTMPLPGRVARDDMPPTLHGLRESGDLENHADVVLLLHRPPVQGMTAGAFPLWLRVAKNRQGPVTPWPADPKGAAVPGGIVLRLRPETLSLVQEPPEQEMEYERT